MEPSTSVLRNRQRFIAVPVPTMEKFRFWIKIRNRIQTIFSSLKKSTVQNLAFLMSEAALFPRKLSFFLLFWICIPFYVLFGSKSGSGSGSPSLLSLLHGQTEYRPAVLWIRIRMNPHWFGSPWIQIRISIEITKNWIRIHKTAGPDKPTFPLFAYIFFALTISRHENGLFRLFFNSAERWKGGGEEMLR